MHLRKVKTIYFAFRLNRQNYPKKGRLSDKIAHFCYQQHCYWKKSRSIFFSLHHMVPIQPDKCINPEATPVPTLKVEIREGPIKRRLAF